jgi:nucleoside phosphorylase
MIHPGGGASNEVGTVPANKSRGFTSLCVVTAADVEFNAVTGLLDQRTVARSGELKLCRGELENQQITVLLSEIGAVGFTEKLARHLAANSYDGLLVIGLAGGLDPQLTTGDTVMYDSCIRIGTAAVSSFETSVVREKRDAREEIASLRCDPQLSTLICERLRAGRLQCRPVTGMTVDRIIINAADKRALRSTYNATAVDMETYQVLMVCARAGLPATAVRVISDEAGQSLPDFNRALEPDGRISAVRAGLSMLMRPVGALHFLLNLRRVMTALKQTAGAALSGASEPDGLTRRCAGKLADSTDSEG